MSWSTIVGSVIMIGHSLFGPDNPRMLDQLLQARSENPVTVEAQILNGAPLQYNWEHADKAEGINARARLRHPADAVIVTEAIPLANHLKWSGTSDAVAQFYELSAAANPDVQFYLQETWHSLRSGSGELVEFDDGMATPWRDRLEQDLPRWQGVVDRANAKTGGQIQLLPAGQAMARLDDAIQAGTVPGITRIQDVFTDDIHPNDIGFYYLALLQYGVLTGDTPVGLPHQLTNRYGARYTAPSPKLALRLQKIAWEAAQGSESRTALPPDPAPLPEEPTLARLNRAVSAQPQGAPTVMRQPVAINLAAIADWSPQAPFLDHFKTARPWVGHIAGQWGGVGHDELAEAGYLDPDGWPTAIPPELGSVGTVILTDLPETALSLAGRYLLRFDGDGIVEVSGRGRNVRYGDQQVWFDYTPGPGPVEIRIQRTDRARSNNYVRNISVVKQEHLDAHAVGALFNPQWLARLQGFSALRFMDWMVTNNSTHVGWENRPQMSDYTWGRNGVPAEVMLALASQLGADPWFTMPHAGNDGYFQNFAQLAASRLSDEQKVYVEYSNEVWNGQFPQAQWAKDQAVARWGSDDLWMQFYGGRAAEMAQIWSAVFGDRAPEQLVRILATQTGWLGLEQQILQAPLWVAEHPDRSAPARSFDAYAVTGYFGGILGYKERADVVRAWIADSTERAVEEARRKGLKGDAKRNFITTHRYDVASVQAGLELRDGLISGDPVDTVVDLLGRVLPYHADIAAEHGLDLIMYEGGSHVVGIGPMVDDKALTGFFTHLNYTPEMGALYAELLAGWQALGGQMFTAYVDVSTPAKWGSWGMLRTLDDDNPRWNALVAVRQ
ncbi:hypothetical protein EBB79_16020 [Parasedimentitalea marina]|uniref:Uncharacterized protein n=1 Tax=Parasedimentitalea marina TaxID=2483033 RepID=A0A3T0N5D7_9RHOB|nr:hypothetical protein [Parasedimentitalea marina]AZV79236.1 hypothetical protein EBB79_16020 [Parasedimentitalea marina]